MHFYFTLTFLTQMKNLFPIATILTLIITLFSSCDEKDDLIIIPEGPTISISSISDQSFESGDTLIIGDTIRVSVEATSIANLSKVEILRNGNSTYSESNFPNPKKISIPEQEFIAEEVFAGQTFNYVFIATDENQKSDSVTISFMVENPTQPIVPATITIDFNRSSDGKYFVGDTLIFDVEVESQSELSKIEIAIEDNLKKEHFLAGNSVQIFQFQYIYIIPENYKGKGFFFNVIAKTAEVEAGSSVLVDVEDFIPISEEADFEFQRVGGNIATGLDKFGLSWTQNNSNLKAIIKTIGATKMIVLDASKFDSITTQEELKEEVDDADAIQEFKGVSVDQAMVNYDFVIATEVEGKYYLLNITSSTAQVNSTLGITATIYGVYKE